jgi:hypothetical protein
MVGAVVLLQLAVTTPPGLEAARTLLEAGDTAAAARQLGEAAGAQRLTPEALASLFLLEWIARGATEEPAVRQWQRLRQPHLRLRADLRSGKLLFGGLVEEAVGDVLVVQREIEQGRVGPEIGKALYPDRTPPDWRAAFDAHASEVEAMEGGLLVAGGIRWVRVRELLTILDRVAAAAPEPPVTRCQPACFRLGQPPTHFRLLARFQEAGHDTTLTQLGALFAGLARAPWPYNALGARAHVALCALARLGPGVAGCWPEGEGLGGREAAEVHVMAHVFRGQHALASRVMDEHPEWFGALDSLRDLVDQPAGARARSRAYTPSLVVPEPDARIPPEWLWKAAWPLYLQDYNERLVVHRARLLLADVLWRLAVDDAIGLFSPFGIPWDIVRVGVPLGATITESRAILAYYPEGTHETAPQTGRAGPSMPLDLAIVATGSRGTRVTGFASEHYDGFGPLDHQVVQYVRDGRRQVDVYTAWQGEPLCAAPRPMLGLFLLDEQLRELRRTTLPELQPGRRVQLRLTLHPARYVYSLELLDTACRRAQRARYVLTVPPPDGAALSDLMLADELHYGDSYRGADRLHDRQPVTLRPALEFPAGGTARFYWEMYGIASDTLAAGRLRIEFEILNVREERVAVRDLARVARDAEEAQPTMDVAYLVNVPPGRGPLTSGLAVGLPADTRGIHIARVTVTDTATGQVTQAQRAFFVRG